MADQEVVSKRRKVVATIVVLEVALLLFRWLLPSRHHVGHDIIPLDMLIVVGCVLFMTYLLSNYNDSPNHETMLQTLFGLIPALFALCDMGVTMGTVIASWFAGLWMLGVMAALSAGCFGFASLLVLGMTPQAGRFFAWLFRPLVLLGRSRPVQAMVNYFNAENV